MKTTTLCGAIALTMAVVGCSSSTDSELGAGGSTTGIGGNTGTGGNAGTGGSQATCTDTVCGDSCVDVNGDRDHCGACDAACASGEVCSGGQCGLSCGGTTPNLCGTSCVDTQTSNAHCGDCDKPCASGEVCSGGTCGLSCGGATPNLCGTSCVDTLTNTAHCGGCSGAGGVVCADGAACVDGSCGCTGGATECGGACVNTATDATHCGGCNDAGGATCPDPGSATGVCVSSACSFVCDTMAGDCNLEAGDGCESDLNTNAAHCGRCDNDCGGNNCVSGLCVDLTAEVRVACAGDSSVQQTLTGAGCTNITASGTASWVSQAAAGGAIFSGPDCRGPYAVLAAAETNLCSTSFSDNTGANDRLGSVWLGPLPTSCEAILNDNPSSTNGPYVVDPDGAGGIDPVQLYCDMQMGGWMLGFLKNSRHNGNYGDFGAADTNLPDLSIQPEAASNAVATVGGWLDLNAFPYTALRLAAYSRGARTYLSRGIAKSDLRIDFGEDGYLLYGTDPSGYLWCGGDASYTDAGVGQINQPSGAPLDCKGHGSLGSGWDFSESGSANQGLTMCGTDASSWMYSMFGSNVVFYGSTGAAQAIWIR